jgi:hypothetical protein
MAPLSVGGAAKARDKGKAGIEPKITKNNQVYPECHELKPQVVVS